MSIWASCNLTSYFLKLLFVTLSCSRATRSVGLLSYTFLRRTGQDDVIVPMVDLWTLYILFKSIFASFVNLFLCRIWLQIDFDVSKHWAEPIVYTSLDDWSTNLKTILEWSPFASKDDLMQQVHLCSMVIYLMTFDCNNVLLCWNTSTTAF